MAESLPTLRIARRAADRLRAAHLWVYRTDLEGAPGAAAVPGALVTVVDSREMAWGTALYSSASQIAARLVSRTPNLSRGLYLDDLRGRLAAAIALRRTMAPVTAADNAHRLVFSEADNVPGIIADRYNDLVIVQLLVQGTAADDVRGVLVEVLREEFSDGALTIWERPDPRIRELEELPPPPAGPLFSSLSSVSSMSVTSRVDQPPTTTTFAVNGVRLAFDVAAGQKTGAFLDQRLNYAAAMSAVGNSGKIKRALDICTYQGGFALHLARVCEQVTGVDASRSALEAADRNLLLNPEIAVRCEVDWIEADAFDYLRHLDGTTAREARFDAMVLDPPAFAKSKRAAEGAARGYKELNLRALRLLAPGGTLVTCSCSHHVSLEEFTAIVAAAAADAGRRVQLLESRAAAPDHPEILTLPETRYLKCLICRVE